MSIEASTDLGWRLAALGAACVAISCSGASLRPCSAHQTYGTRPLDEEVANAASEPDHRAVSCFVETIGTRRCAQHDLSTLPDGTPLVDAESSCWVSVQRDGACLDGSLQRLATRCHISDLALVVPWNVPCDRAAQALQDTLEGRAVIRGGETARFVSFLHESGVREIDPTVVQRSRRIRRSSPPGQGELLRLSSVEACTGRPADTSVGTVFLRMIEEIRFSRGRED